MTFDQAFAVANQNFNSFGYLAIMAAMGLWLAYSQRAVFHRLNIPAIAPPAGLFVAALAIRLITLGAESLWYDEAFTGVIARLPLDRMIAATASDVHPPAFYLLEWLAIRIWGSSEFGLRLLPALFSAGAAWLVYDLASDTLTQRGALAAGAAAAIMPGLIYYGQEARSYSMLALLLLLCLWAARRRRWVLYGAALGLALYTHNYSFLYAGAMLAYGALWDRNPTPRLLATIGAGLCYLPWLPTLWAQVGAVDAGYWIPPLLPGRAIIEPLLTVLVGYRAPGLITLGALGAALALTIAAVQKVLRLEWLTGGGELVIFALLPAGAALAVSYAISPVYLPRGFIASAYVLIILWVYWLASAPQIIKQLSIICILIIFLYHFSPASNARADVRGAVDSLNIWPGDTVYHVDEQSYILFEYYAPQADNILAAYPADLAWGLSRGTRQALAIPEAYQPAGRYLVLAGGSGRPEAQRALLDWLMPDYEPIVTLYSNSTQEGAVYEFRTNPG